MNIGEKYLNQCVNFIIIEKLYAGKKTITQFAHIDWYILLSVSGLMLFSIAFVYSASAGFRRSKVRRS